MDSGACSTMSKLSAAVAVADDCCWVMPRESWASEEPADEENEKNSNELRKLESLRDLERRCEEGDDVDLWRALAIAAAVSMTNVLTLHPVVFETPGNGWRNALASLNRYRSEHRQRYERPGEGLRDAHAAADSDLADELNLFFDWLLETKDDDMPTTAKRKTSKQPNETAILETIGWKSSSEPVPPDYQAKVQSQPFAPASVAPLVTPPAAGKMSVVSGVVLALDKIQPSPENPREDWDAEFLRTLGESLRDNGQLTPLSVRTPNDDGIHEIIDGETRYRAAMAIGLPTLLCTVVDCTDAEAALARVLSYRQRRDLNAIEEAKGLKLLLTKYGCTQRELEEKIGVSQGQISNRIRLLDLPKNWQQRVIAKEISATCARELAAWLPHPEIFPELDRMWANHWGIENIKSDPGEACEEAVAKVSLALYGRTSDYPSIEWQIDPEKLDPKIKERLHLREVTINGKKGLRAFNKKLAEELKQAAIEAAKKKRSKAADRKDQKADKAELTPAQKKEREAKQADVLHKKVWRYYVDWHQKELLKRLDDPESAPPAEQVALWLIYQGAQRFDYSNDRAPELAKALGLRRDGDSLSEIADPATHSNRWDEVVLETAKLWLSHRFEGSSTDLKPATIVAFAKAAGVEIDQQWSLDAEFLELHNKDQLMALAKEWKVDYAAKENAKRSDLITLLLACKSVKAPKSLQKPKEIGLW